MASEPVGLATRPDHEYASLVAEEHGLAAIGWPLGQVLKFEKLALGKRGRWCWDFRMPSGCFKAMGKHNTKQVGCSSSQV